MPENRRILLLDDEPEIRSGYKYALLPRNVDAIVSSRIGPSSDPLPGPPLEREFEIVEAESGEQGLELLLKALEKGVHFAGAFVDVRMPGKWGGLEFILEAWKHDPDLNIVVVTAYQDRSVNEINQMFTQPFQDQWDYLNKPFTSGEIIQKARNIVSSWNRRAREKQYLLELQEHQKALIDQERLAAVGRLARSVGHEFGNVLQPLLALLDIAKVQVEQGDLRGLQTSIDEMLEAATLGATVCQDLLTFSRETQEPPLGMPQSIPFLSTLHQSLRLLRHEIKKRDVQVDIQVPEDVVVRFQGPQLTQVLVNLLKNSIEALPEGGHIWVTAETSPTHLTLWVRDNGEGISKENRTHLFEPLFSTKGSAGNGIGLVTCKQILEANSGEISIDSREKEGTTVTLKLQKA